MCGCGLFWCGLFLCLFFVVFCVWFVFACVFGCGVWGFVSLLCMVVCWFGLVVVVGVCEILFLLLLYRVVEFAC